MRGWWLVGLLVGCSDGDGKGDGPAGTGDTGPDGPDGDGDGSPDDADCDPADPTVHPGAEEACDGLDNDCDPGTGEPTGAVGVEGLGAFASIGEAVAAAPDGGTVRVCGGVWRELVVIDGKVVSLLGADRPTIDAEGLGAAIEIRTAARVEGFVITGGTGSPEGPRPTNGGGINAYAAGGVVDIVGCEVHDNLADLGGGILFGPAGGTLEDTVVRDNVAGLYGGGVYATGDVTVTGSEISDNVANDNGGGLVVGDGAIVTIPADTLVEGNTANAGGGIFAFEDGELDATGATVAGNRATSAGGGIYLESADLVGGLVEDDDGGLLGGGVYADDGSRVEATTIRANVAESGAGLVASGAVDLVGVTIVENSATARGGGVYAFDADVVADDATVVEDNDAPQSGGGVWMRASSWTGGSVTGNDADEGGGFYLSSDGTNANTLVDVDIADNTAVVSGGGVFAGSTFAVSGISFLRNVALERGGGLYTTFDAVGTVDASTLTSNAATQRGGGLYANTASTVTLSDTSIDRNVALRGAGIYINAESTVTLLDCVVEANGDATTESGGGARVTAGVLVSSGSDWGGALTENVPDDTFVEVSQLDYVGYEADETFTCDVYACVPAP